MRLLASALATASALFASSVSAQAGDCPVPDKFCMQIGVPQASAASGSGNMYFQIQALESYAWAAIGTGSSMSGSTMFIVYADGAGNVTVSPRSGTGHTQPRANQNVQVQLLEGSGVSGGIMTANVLCANCDQVVDLSSGSTSWIAGYRAGSAINSDSISANIAQHNGYKTFDLDMSRVQVASDVNPFVAGATGGNGNGGSNTGDSDTTNGIGGNNTNAATTTKNPINLILLHGIIMAVAFIFMYPVGAILMPLVGKWLVHAGWQMVAFMAMWAGFGVGYKKASDSGTLFKQSHTILGTVVCCAMIVQPVIGFLHHQYYKKHQTRGLVSYAHIWYGRLIMVLGILNGGLGLKLSNASNTFVIAYSVIAAIIGVAYIASGYVGEMRRSRRQKETYSPSYSPSYSPTAGTQAYKPQGRVQYSPVQSTFNQQAPPRPQQYGAQYGGQQQRYGGRDQYQSNNRYGSYR